MKMRAIIGIIFLSISVTLFAQSKTEIIEIKQKGIGIEIKEHTHNHRFGGKTQNEIQFVIKSIFVVYKKTISSQDIESCVFTPSCSVYAIESISKCGAVIGLLATFDRLTRCHPFHKNEYPIDPKTRKFYDPVEN